MGSGTKVQDVNRLLKQFGEMKKMMRKLKTQQAAPSKKGKKGKGKKSKLPNLGDLLSSFAGGFPFRR